MRLRLTHAETAWRSPSISALAISATAFSNSYAPDFGVPGRGASANSAAPQAPDVRGSAPNERSLPSGNGRSRERGWEAPAFTALGI